MSFGIRYPNRPKDRFLVGRRWQAVPAPRLNRETRRYKLTDPTRLPAKPTFFEEMVEAAEHLAAPFPFVRLDLYHQRGAIYLGEFTFTPFATFLGYPRAWDLRFGAYLDLDRARHEIAQSSAITF